MFLIYIMQVSTKNVWLHFKEDLLGLQSQVFSKLCLNRRAERKTTKLGGELEVFLSISKAHGVPRVWTLRCFTSLSALDGQLCTFQTCSRGCNCILYYS